MKEEVVRKKKLFKMDTFYYTQMMPQERILNTRSQSALTIVDS